MDHCVENNVYFCSKLICYVSVLYHRDQICLVKFLFTSSREYFILFRSFFCNTGPLFSLRSFLRMDVGGRYTVPAIFAHFNTRYRTNELSFPLSFRAPYRIYNLEFNSQLNYKTTSNRFKQQPHLMREILTGSAEFIQFHHF